MAFNRNAKCIPMSKPKKNMNAQSLIESMSGDQFLNSHYEKEEIRGKMRDAVI